MRVQFTPRDPLCEPALATNELMRPSRDPLCEEAMRTNRELRSRVDELERRERGKGGVRSRLVVCERELLDRRSSPWTYLPWKGYIS